MTDGLEMPMADDRGSDADMTPTERYLRDLCQRNFLSFWSHPRPFRDQGGPKELCDLLVVMGDDVIIFSDKHCELNPEVEIGVAWKRWFRAAVEGAAKQAWGAERWLREHPDRVFADDTLLRRLPLEIPDPVTARYHLVVTVHGIAKPCRAAFGGSGSLILNTSIKGTPQHDQPFTIGDLDPDRTFVHVLDDTTMDIVLETLDTIADFVGYLREKERVCRLGPAVAAAGEENLLAYYLTHLNDDGEHSMVMPSDADYMALDETFWPHFEQSDERRAQLDHDEVSYRWDALIERFAAHALTGTQYAATEPVLESSEKVLRFLAAETRFRRRLLANALLEAVRNTPANMRFLRVLPSQAVGEPMYVFVACPWSEHRTDDENRAFRRAYLEACMGVARMKYRNADDVIGIATESGARHNRRSEDAVYLDAREWSADDDRRAREDQKNLRVLVAERGYSVHINEYPVTGTPRGMPLLGKNPRNKPCFCGSGQKYKHCHGRA